MPENADDGEDHAGEVAVCVAHENLGRIPVVVQQCAGGADPREEEIERKQMGVCCRVGIRREEVEAIVERQEQRDDDTL